MKNQSKFYFLKIFFLIFTALHSGHALPDNKIKKNGTESGKGLTINLTAAETLILEGNSYCSKAQQSSIFSALRLAKKCISRYSEAVDAEPENTEALVLAIGFYLEAPSLAGGNKKRSRPFKSPRSHITRARGYI